ATETAAAERTRDKQEAAQFAAASTGLFMQLFTGRAGIHDQYAEKGFPVEVRYTGSTREGIAARFADGTRYHEPTEPSNATNARVASWFVPAYRVAATGVSALNVARVAVGNVFDDLASGYAGRAASDATGGRLATVPLPIGSMVMGGAVRSAAAANVGSGRAWAGVAPTVVQRTNGELVQDIATRAEAWGTRHGLGNGSAAGTLKHGYADRVLTRYQQMFGNRGLSTEARYINGVPWAAGDPLKGSIRLDVVEGPLNNPTWIWDYKFGGAQLTPARINQIRTGAGLGPNVPVVPVRP
ncbi:MAG: hypothetical protein ACK5SI_14250, partial [Planctomycetia bacterium]